ncbi:MAG: hypothetical protein ICCCNLDF_03082 [Planctomycetes bacterium]|nr:hypothetical protein [Planctomycetota bacterium]
MRSSITIFLIGLVLGSTLGIGGLWTQVVQPAYQQIKELKDEQGIMREALSEAGQTLREVAGSLRGEAAPAPEPIPGGAIAPRSSLTPEGTAPRTTESLRTTELQPTDRRAIADKLDALAVKLDTVKSEK